MIIDIHAHSSIHKLWDLHRETATILDLENEAKKYSVKKIFLMATYFPYKGSGLKNETLFERIKDNNLFGMFVSLDASADVEKAVFEMRELVQSEKVVGIKLYPGYQEFSLSEEKLFPLYGLAKEFSLPITIHVGCLHHCCQKDKRKARKIKCGNHCKIDAFSHLARPSEAETVIKKYPEINFILAHMGNPYFSEVRELMKKYKNVYSDMSGQFVSGTGEDTSWYRDKIRVEMETLLVNDGMIDRFMFGTDFPIQSYEDSIELVNSLELSKKEKEKIFFRNAVKLFEL